MGNDEILARAFGYPYDHVSYPFNFRLGEARELTTYSAAAMIDAGYKPVLGVGSNCAPEQLRRKFGGPERTMPVKADGSRAWGSSTRQADLPGRGYSITVAPARLAHFDVVYAASIAHYGSIPATLQGAPDTVVDVCVTFLGQRELARMHQTEAVGVAYDFAKLSGILLLLSNGERLTEAWTYMGRRGCLMVDGQNVALSAMRAENRRLPALSEREMLERVWRDYDKGKHATLEDFVLSLIGPDNAARREVLYYSFAQNEFDPGDVTVTEDNPLEI